jgi:Histidine kinase-, DNA gyrase B-, and HSP90-like ATPase
MLRLKQTIFMSTSNQKELVDIAPRTTFLKSFRNNTLSNEEAIADLIDNALEIDVNATKVEVIKSPNQLIIADNGSGMVQKTLLDALRLGPTHNAAASDLGLFGIGLKNAPTSLGRKFTVITKHADDKHQTAIYDLDKIIQLNQFTIPLYESSKEEIKWFADLTKNATTGTVIIIEKLDRIEVNRDADFKNRLIKHLSEVFRVFIKDGKEITINGTKIEYRDILKGYYTNQESEINDQLYTFKYPGEEGQEFKIRIRIGLLPPVLTSEKNKHGVSSGNQGFYVLRNDRQLMHGTWFDMVSYHPKFNRIRAEIYFTGDQDDVFTINYEKNQLQPKKWFLDQLHENVFGVINGHVARVIQENKNKELNDGNREVHKRIKDDIESKANRIPALKTSKYSSIRKPKVPNSTLQENTNNEVTAETSLKNELVQIKEGSKRKRDLVDFGVENLSSSFICRYEDQGNGALRIIWNVNHPFYPFYLLQEIPTQSAFSKLLFSLGRAVVKLATQTPEYEHAMDELQIQMGEEFRKLMD